MPPFFVRLRKLIHISEGLVSKLRMCVLYTLLVFKRKCGFSPCFEADHAIGLSVNKMTFPVYVRELLDFDLMIEIFIDEEYRLPPANVDDVKVIFDVGSNIGITVLYFLSKYPNAKVFAFEPVGLNIERLAKNVRYFENRVVLCPRAVYYSENGRIEMHINPRLHWSSSVSNRKNNTEIVVVDTITLEKAMKENNIEAIDILKFDAEGSEYNVLSHFKNMNTVSLFIGEFHPDLAGDEYCDVSKFFGGHIMLFRRNIGGSRYVAAFSHKSKS